MRAALPFSDLVAAVPAPQAGSRPLSARSCGQPFTVIVDYAHTDDALRNLTALARQMTAQGSTENAA